MSELVPWTWEWLREYHKRKGQPLPMMLPTKPARQKLKQFDHQKGLCCWCLEPMSDNPNAGNGDPNFATWEHIIPVSHGGSDKLINLVLAHYKCNQERGNQPCRTPHFQSYTIAGDRNA